MGIQKLSLVNNKTLEANTKEILGAAKAYNGKNKLALNALNGKSYYYNATVIDDFGEKISKALKGRPKPDGFGEKISKRDLASTPFSHHDFALPTHERP